MISGCYTARAGTASARHHKAADVAQTTADVQASGTSSLHQIAAALNERGIPAARGGECGSGEARDGTP